MSELAPGFAHLDLLATLLQSFLRSRPRGDPGRANVTGSAVSQPADPNTDEPHLFAERDSPQTIDGGLPDKIAESVGWSKVFSRVWVSKLLKRTFTATVVTPQPSLRRSSATSLASVAITLASVSGSPISCWKVRSRLWDFGSRCVTTGRDRCPAKPGKETLRGMDRIPSPDRRDAWKQVV